MQYIKEIEVIKSNTLKTDEEIVEDILILLSYYLKEQQLDRYTIEGNKLSFENIHYTSYTMYRSHMHIVRKGKFELKWMDDRTLVLEYNFKLRFYTFLPFIGGALLILAIVGGFYHYMLFLVALFLMGIVLLFFGTFDIIYFLVKKLNHYHYFKNKLPFRYIVQGDTVTPLFF